MGEAQGVTQFMQYCKGPIPTVDGGEGLVAANPNGKGRFAPCPDVERVSAELGKTDVRLKGDADRGVPVAGALRDVRRCAEIEGNIAMRAPEVRGLHEKGLALPVAIEEASP